MWGHQLRINIETNRTEDWYGSAGFVRRRRGNFSLAKIDMHSWNKWLREMIHEGDTVIDCGANEGWTTCIFAKQVGPKGRVIAIEADSLNVARIKTNVELNGLQNVEILHRAVGATTGAAVLFSVERVVGDARPDHRCEAVSTIALDDFADIRPDVIKVDVEGYELAVLRGATKVLAAGARWEIELHLTPGGAHMTEWFGFEPADIMHILQEQHGYTVKIDGHELARGELPHHGAVWAHRGERIVHAERGGR